MPTKDEKKAFVVAHPPLEEGKEIKHFEAKTKNGDVVHKSATEKETAEGAEKKGYEVHIAKNRDAYKKGDPKPEHFKKYDAADHEKEVKENKRPHKAGDHHDKFHG